MDCSLTCIFSRLLPSFLPTGLIFAAFRAPQDAIANFTTEHEIASSIKAKFEQQFPST